MARHFLALVAALGWAAVAAADSLPDPGKVDRHILKQPAYTAAKPLYGLLVFGPRADKRIRMVLDKSKPDLNYYDVLYVDRNADGDLTASDERLLATQPEGFPMFTLPELKDPATGAVHTEFRVRVTGDRPDVMISLKWCGKKKMGGGYPPDPGPYMQFALIPDNAPVVWFQGDGPFRFQR
jgi:hypothetical protein